MPKKSIDHIKIPTYDDLFTTEEQRQELKLEKVMSIPINKIHEFKNHLFKVRMDEDMVKLVESIPENGIILLTLVRSSPSGKGYEMVSGHRRMKAAELNQLETVPAIICDLTDDQATIIMVDSNIQREHILPSERGFAYKMKLDAMKQQGKRSDLTCAQLGHKLKGAKSVEILAQEVGESKNQIKRYIRLTELIEPLRDLVDGIREDKKKIALNPAVELSYLSKEHQEIIVGFIDELNVTPSHAQTIRMKELFKESRLDENVIYSIISEEKPNQMEKLSIKMDTIDKYFPKGFAPNQKENIILKLLDSWAKKRDKEHSR
ncbi:MAG: ParB/RepB/Spo0J family partition protein [Coprobacillus sp.]